MSSSPKFPFFIVGSGRSGTTLLRMILAAHSRITIPPETWYLLQLAQKLPLTGTLSSSQAREAADIISTHYRWPDQKLDTEEFRQRAINLRSASLREIVDLVYDHHRKRDGKARWGDKTPPYIQIVPQLHALYPEAKFIYLVRDGHDVAKSFQATNWYGQRLHANTTEWTQSCRLYQRYLTDYPEIPFLEVKYETLVMDIEGTTRRICTYLEEPFEPTMLDWRSEVTAKIPEREAKAGIHSKLSRSPRQSDVFRWTREMSPVDTLIIEAYAHRELTQHNYRLRYERGPWLLAFWSVRLFCTAALPVAAFSKRLALFAVRRIRRMAAPRYTGS